MDENQQMKTDSIKKISDTIGTTCLEIMANHRSKLGLSI